MRREALRVRGGKSGHLAIIEERKTMLKPFEPFDYIKREFGLKNDAELARELAFTPPQVSKVRSGIISFTDTVVLRIHEVFGLPVAQIRELGAKRAQPEAESAQ
jgi:plasmid maintenance system antidote protein VapI